MTREPRSLPSLLRWYRGVVEDDTPTRLHNRDTADDGAPQWHASLRAYLMASPRAVDDDGFVRSPYRFWLAVMRSESRQNRVAADFLFQLARRDGDWRSAVSTITPLTRDGEEIARCYAVVTLSAFWRRMATEPQRHLAKA